MKIFIFLKLVVKCPTFYFNYITVFLLSKLNNVISMIYNISATIINLYYSYIQSIGSRLHYNLALIFPFSTNLGSGSNPFISDQTIIYYISLIRWLIIVILLFTFYHHLNKIYNTNQFISKSFNHLQQTFKNIVRKLRFNSYSDNENLFVKGVVRKDNYIQFYLTHDKQLPSEILLRAIYNTLYKNDMFKMFGHYKMINILAYCLKPNVSFIDYKDENDVELYTYLDNIIVTDTIPFSEFKSNVNYDRQKQFVETILYGYNTPFGSDGNKIFGGCLIPINKEKLIVELQVTV